MAIPNWLSLEKTSGTGNDTVKVTAKTNNGEARSAIVTVKTSSGLTRTVSIEQAGTIRVTTTMWCMEATGEVQNIYPDLAIDDTGGRRYPIWYSELPVFTNSSGDGLKEITNVPEMSGRELTAFNLGMDRMDGGGYFPEGTVFYINNWTFKVNGTTKAVSGTGSVNMYPVTADGAANYVNFEFPNFIVQDGDELELEIRMVIQLP